MSIRKLITRIFFIISIILFLFDSYTVSRNGFEYLLLNLLILIFSFIGLLFFMGIDP